MSRLPLRPATTALLLALAVVPLSLAGCGKGAGLPKEISTREVETGVAAIFKTATPETRKLAEEVVAAIQKQDFPTAWEKLQTLGQQPGLSDSQKEFVASSTASVATEVRKAEASGDEAAKQALEFHRANK